MRIAIFANSGYKSQNIKKKIRQKFIDRHFILDDVQPEIVVSIGGDGTLLSAFHYYQSQLDTIRFVGVHTGHLGFYTDWRDDEIDDLVISLQSDNKQSVSYPLLEVLVQHTKKDKAQKYLALNESTIKHVSSTLVTDVKIGGEAFERFRGDGMCISTPTGSTAYNKSVGGAVIHPRLEAIQLAEISSINNRVFRTLSSPIIIAPNDWITLYPMKSRNSKQELILTIDSEAHHDIDVKKIRYKIAKERIYFAKYRHMHFWKRVQDSFIGDDYGD